MRDVLGRAMGLVVLGHAGTKPLGLIAIGPLFALVDPTAVFVALRPAVSGAAV